MQTPLLRRHCPLAPKHQSNYRSQRRNRWLVLWVCVCILNCRSFSTAAGQLSFGCCHNKKKKMSRHFLFSNHCFLSGVSFLPPYHLSPVTHRHKLDFISFWGHLFTLCTPWSLTLTLTITTKCLNPYPKLILELEFILILISTFKS